MSGVTDSPQHPLQYQDDLYIWPPQTHGDSVSHSRDISDDNDGSVIFHHFLPEADQSQAVMTDDAENIDFISEKEDTTSGASASHDAAGKGKSRFFDTNKRRLQYLKSRLLKHVEDEKIIDRMLEMNDPLVLHYEKQYKLDQKWRDKKAKMRKLLEKRPDDIDLQMKVLSVYGETPEEFLKGRRPRGDKVDFDMSEKRRQAVRDVYRKLQGDIQRYNDTSKTKKPYDMTGSQARKQEQIDQDPQGLQFREGNAEADAMVIRMQNLRDAFCQRPRDSSIIPQLVEMHRWMVEKKFKYRPLLLPRDFTELTL